MKIVRQRDQMMQESNEFKHQLETCLSVKLKYETMLLSLIDNLQIKPIIVSLVQQINNQSIRKSKNSLCESRSENCFGGYNNL